MPVSHISAPLQGFESWHDVPSVTTVALHPVTGSQASVVHILPSLQLSGVPGVQTPAWHVSEPLHTLLSAQSVPSVTAACWHPPVGSQVSAVHGLWSSHPPVVPALHVPDWHVSM